MASAPRLNDDVPIRPSQEVPELAGALARIDALEVVNDTQRERIAELERMLGLRIKVPIELGLTSHEAALVGFLLTREIAPKEAILSAIYGHLPAGDEPQLKIIDVFVCKARQKLAPFEIEIETVWGRGYRLTTEMKKKVRAMLPAPEQPVEQPPEQGAPT